MKMVKTINREDQQLLQGIIHTDAQQIKQIYDLVLPSVIRWVKENKGSEADARDVFQEALLALYRKLEAGDFELTCTLKSFIRIMCRNLWLNRLRNQNKFHSSSLNQLEIQGEVVELDDHLMAKIEQSEKEQLFFKHFDGLGEKCKKILQLFFDKVPLKTIANELNTSENYIKKRKFICKEKLVQAVQNDVLFQELKDY